MPPEKIDKKVLFDILKSLIFILVIFLCGLYFLNPSIFSKVWNTIVGWFT